MFSNKLRELQGFNPHKKAIYEIYLKGTPISVQGHKISINNQ